MKIAFIGQKGIPTVTGGVERRVEEISVRMAKEGHEVFVYARKNYLPQKRTEFKGVKLIHLPSISTKNLGTITHTFLATIHALFQDYDVIHFQAPGPSSLSWIIKIFKPKAALVATFNSRDTQHQKWGFWARKYLLLGEFVMSKFPDKTLTVSEILRKYIKEKYRTEAEVVHNGSAILESPRIELAKEWNLENKKYFLSVSRLVRHKGVHILIEAFHKAQKRRLIPSDFKLAIVGEGSFTNDYVEELRALASQNENIVFTGNQKGERLAALFQNAFSFVQSSYAEGLSNALLEAMGYGLCPIVSNIEENLYPLDGNGIIFEKQNADDLAYKLAFAFKSKELVENLGAKARLHVKNNYSWEDNTKKTLSIYKKILNKKRTAVLSRKNRKIKTGFNF